MSGHEHGERPGDGQERLGADGEMSRRRFSLLGAAAMGAAGLSRLAPSRPPDKPAPDPTGSPGPVGRRPTTPVGFVLGHEQFRTPELVAAAERAERAGFTHVWTSDHAHPWQDNEGHAMFPWITLALVGDRTSRLTYGTGVTCPLYRYHPSQVAQAFASFGVLTPGRVFLGVGTGEALNEQASTGRFGRYPERHDRLVEAIQLIRRLWTGKRTTFKGDYYRTDQYRLYDVPDRPVPIYVAASGPRSAHLAGRYGDGWIAQVKDLTTPALHDQFVKGARAAGKDPDSMPKLVETWVVVGDQTQAEQAAQKWRFTVHGFGDLLYQPNPVTIQRIAERRWTLPEVYRSWPRGTDPDVHVKALQRIIDAGGTPFVHSGQEDQARVIDFYAREVLPHLRP